MTIKNSKKGLISLDIAKAAGPISSISAIVVGLLIGLVIMLITNPSSAFSGFGMIIGGGLQSLKDFGDVLYYATPIIMTGLSVAFAFRTNLFNIGTPGQFILGAFGAVLVGVHGEALGSFQWVVALLASMIFGAIWALLPGIMKAYFNVNEVISCIMTNYIGMYLVNWLVVETVYHKLTNRSLPVAASANIPKMGLDLIFPGSLATGGFVIAVLIAVLLNFILNRTTFGFELKACGFNKDASRYAGINAKKNIVLSMLIAGALAGIGGGLLYLAGSGKYIYVEDILASQGFMGIPVALLGMSHPIGALFAGIFIAYLTVGGSYMQLAGFVPEIIDIITAVIIYFAAFALILRNVLQRLRYRKAGEKA